VSRATNTLIEKRVSGAGIPFGPSASFFTTVAWREGGNTGRRPSFTLAPCGRDFPVPRLSARLAYQRSRVSAGGLLDSGPLPLLGAQGNESPWEYPIPPGWRPLPILPSATGSSWGPGQPASVTFGTRRFRGGLLNLELPWNGSSPI
jgi:hypothetical protein